jgi:hypothetical protein
VSDGGWSVRCTGEPCGYLGRDLAAGPPTCGGRSPLRPGRLELGSRGAPRRGDRLAPIRATSAARIWWPPLSASSHDSHQHPRRDRGRVDPGAATSSPAWTQSRSRHSYRSVPCSRRRRVRVFEGQGACWVVGRRITPRARHAPAEGLASLSCIARSGSGSARTSPVPASVSRAFASCELVCRHVARPPVSHDPRTLRLSPLLTASVQRRQHRAMGPRPVEARSGSGTCWSRSASSSLPRSRLRNSSERRKQRLPDCNLTEEDA